MLCFADLLLQKVKAATKIYKHGGKVLCMHASVPAVGTDKASNWTAGKELAYGILAVSLSLGAEELCVSYAFAFWLEGHLPRRPQL